MITTFSFLRRVSQLVPALFAVFLVAGLEAQTIPADRRVDWTPGVMVGVPDGIGRFMPGGANQRTNLIDVTKAPYNADKTGASDAAPAIQAAINAARSGDVVFLPAGRYRANSTLYLAFNSDGITLRGEGAQTILDSRTSSAAVMVGTASDYNWAYPASGNVVTAGLSKGSTNITIADTSAFASGRIARMSIENDNRLPVVNVNGFLNTRKQTVVVKGKTASTLTVWPPLHADYSTLRTTVNVAQLQTDFVGIENLVIDCSNANTIYGVQFEQTYGCWMFGVRVINSSNYGFFLYDSVNCEIRRCFADRRKTEGSNGAGVLCNTSTGCLIEDNILLKYFPLVEVNQGASGNVFGYNFCEDSSIWGAVGCSINSNHGSHNSFNLYEGNVAANVQCDGYFGSASHDTIFRNWLHTMAPGNLSGAVSVILNRFARQYSIVGNVVGKSGLPLLVPYSFGNPNMGNGMSSGTAQPSAGDWWADWGRTPGPAGFQEKDLDVEATSYLKGNYNALTGTVPSNEALGNEVLPGSLYLTSKPSWWGSTRWPAFGPDLNPQIGSIPAQDRFNGVTPPSVVAPSNLRVVP